MKKDRWNMTLDFFRSFYRNRYKLNDRFVIRDGKKHPLAIICPGGGYKVVCSFIEGRPFAKELNKRGISAVIVYYRVRWRAKYPNPQNDLARAVREVLEHAEEYGVDPEHYSVWGSSAGGHLAACFGTKELGYEHYGLKKPESLVLIYPVITMHRDLAHMGSRGFLLGEDANEEAESRVSVDEHVTKEYPRTFLWCGDADKSVPPDNSRHMDEALTKAGVDHRFILYHGVGHGVGKGDGTVAANWIDEAVDFWMAS